MKKNDIFISFSGDEGKEYGQYICRRLKKKGYSVDFDENPSSIENDHEGKQSIIEGCKDVIIILSSNILEKLTLENDRMRFEIAHALKLNKNVIIIVFGEFIFPIELPKDIENIQSQKKISLSLESIDTSIKEICESLKSKPSILQRIYHYELWVRVCIVTGFCMLMILGLWGGATKLQHKSEVTAYPVIEEQKSDIEYLLDYSKINLKIMDNIFFIYYGVIEACEEYVKDMSLESYNELVITIEDIKKTLKQQGNQVQKPPHQFAMFVADIGIDGSELTALWQLPKIIVGKYENTLDFLKFALNPNKPIPLDFRWKLLAINKELVQLDVDSTLVGISLLLFPIDEKAMIEFETEFLPSLLMISNGLEVWGKEEVQLKRELEKLLRRQQELIVEYRELTNSNQNDFQSRKESLILLFTEEGMSPEEAENYIDNKLEKSQPFIDSIKN